MYVCLVPIKAAFPRIGVMDVCELPGGCWELNPRPLEEQQVLLQLSHLSSSLHVFLEAHGGIYCKFYCMFSMCLCYCGRDPR